MHRIHDVRSVMKKTGSMGWKGLEKKNMKRGKEKTIASAGILCIILFFSFPFLGTSN